MIKWLFGIIFVITNLMSYEIQNYKIIKKYFVKDSDKYMAIREFLSDNNKYYLVVNINTLDTKIYDDKELHSTKSIDTQKLDSIYTLAKIDSTKMYNAGITKAQNTNNRYYLTIDMCPSTKEGYEDRLFSNIQNKKINIALTAKWAIKHTNEFNQLKKNKNITWINHTYSHYYAKDEPLKNNFLLHKDTNLEYEIIENEKFMIQNGIIPSIFVRFPGLVSDTNIINKIVNEYHLLPLGTDTWIAKGDSIHNSSIILVHGNLNEPKGIDILLQTDIDDMLFESVNRLFD